MFSKNIKQIRGLFDHAVELPPEERQTFLKKACGKDTKLLQTILDLLNADEDSHSVFQEQVMDLVHQEISQSYINTKIGIYRIKDELGSGGMGMVYLAEREQGDFQQKVAIKILKRGMDSVAISRRFQNERQILARLEHPSIARLYDGGITEDGLPFFTMEYVQGIPIDTYCDQHKLSIKERLLLFQTVCSAVQYAHRNLLIHRDLKPANILVTEEGEVKLLDFGIAKAFSLDTDTGVVSITLTQPGMRVMTPQYASPEQIRGENVDISTDIYSLGIILYKLLTGSMPYRIEDKSLVEIEQIILNNDPDKPSTVIGKLNILGEGEDKLTFPLRAVSMDRNIQPERLKKTLSGDLDNICLMALKKEPERRYGSVEQFSEDISRYLSGLPVIARPDTINYRAQKFVLRHKRGLITAGSVMIMVVALILYYTGRLADERDIARLEAEKSEKVTQFLIDLFKVSDPSQSRGETITARELLDSSVVRIDDELDQQPEVKAQLLEVMGQVYQSIGLYDDSERLLNEALELKRSIYAGQDIEIAKILSEIGVLYESLGRHKEAGAVQEQAIEILQSHPDTPPLLLASTLHSLAHAQMRQYQLVKAEKNIRQAVDIKRKILGDNNEEVAYSMNILGDVLTYQNRNKEAEEIHRKVLAMRRKLLGNNHPDVAVTLHNLAASLRNQKRYSEAEKYFREAYEIERKTLGDEHPEIANVLSQLALVIGAQGRSNESAEIQLRALNLFRKVYKGANPRTANSLAFYGRALVDEGRYREAEDAYREAVAMRRELNIKNDPNEMFWLAGLAKAVWQQGHFTEAEHLLDESYNLCDSLTGIHPDCKEVLPKYFIELYEAWGRPDEADKYR